MALCSPRNARVDARLLAGELACDHTGRASEDPTLVTENRWLAPNRPSHVHLWLVLRDNRGGVTHANYELDTR